MCATHTFQAPEPPFPEHFLLMLLAVPRLEAALSLRPARVTVPAMPQTGRKTTVSRRTSFASTCSVASISEHSTCFGGDENEFLKSCRREVAVNMAGLQLDPMRLLMV